MSKHWSLRETAWSGIAVAALLLAVWPVLGQDDRPIGVAADGRSSEFQNSYANDALLVDRTRRMGRPTRPLIDFELLAPTSPRNRDTIVPDSGWPLAVRLVATGDPFLSIFFGSDFPSKDSWGFILWDDPDDCLSWDSENCADRPADETVLQFRSNEREPIDLGPSPDLPALVLLADTGVGWDDEGPVLRGLNLAGLVSTVGYELNDSARNTNVLVTLVAPFGAFAPRVDEDSCLGDPATCDGSALFRVRGYEGETFAVPPEGRCDRYVEIFDNRPVVLRMFVAKLPPSRSPTELVEGPASLEDFDANGLVDIHDAELQGYELLSEELVLEFRQIFGPGSGDEFVRQVDLDGNGVAVGPAPPCPQPTPSPVGAKKPPR